MAVLIRLLIVVAVIALNVILGFYRGRGIQASDPLSFYITCSFVVVYLLYEWKNKVELVKRCILAAPFVALFAIVFRIAGFETVVSVHFGIIIFLLLLVVKTDNWKRHFFITLLTAVILTPLIVYLYQQVQKGDLNIYEIIIIFGLACTFAVFYGAYLCALSLQKTIRWCHLAVKAIMLSGALSLILTLLLISHFSFRHSQFGSGISFMISVLLSFLLLWFCYRFKLSAPNSSINKFIDEEKMRFYIRGKYKNNNSGGKCELCGRQISSSEVSHFIKDHTVCEQCYKKIEEEKARIT